MASSFNKLTAREIAAHKGTGKLSDGGGLSLNTAKTGTRSWVFRYRWQNERPEIGLGGFPAVSLADARTKVQPLRDALKETPKRDPRALLRDLENEAAKPAIDIQTFGEYAERVVPEITATLRNAKHRAQWLSTLRTYAAPLWEMPIDEVDRKAVYGCINAIWLEKQDTARRTLGRIERVLDRARFDDLRTGDNPARWRGNMALALPVNKEPSKHHQALPFRELPAFWSALSKKDSLSAKALAFTVLTCVRASEARNVPWSEIDLDDALWIIPAERMKLPREHRVPLSRQAVALLREVHEMRRGPFVFWGQSKGALSETSVRKTLASVAPKGTTTHGFRSTFKDWTTETTLFPDELGEMCLAHAVGDATRRAYARSDGLERRAQIMQSWADYVTGEQSSNVVTLRA